MVKYPICMIRLSGNTGINRQVYCMPLRPESRPDNTAILFAGSLWRDYTDLERIPWLEAIRFRRIAHTIQRQGDCIRIHVIIRSMGSIISTYYSCQSAAHATGVHRHTGRQRKLTTARSVNSAYTVPEYEQYWSHLALSLVLLPFDIPCKLKS